jgi:hypothetical protein
MGVRAVTFDAFAAPCLCALPANCSQADTAVELSHLNKRRAWLAAKWHLFFLLARDISCASCSTRAQS